MIQLSNIKQILGYPFILQMSVVVHITKEIIRNQLQSYLCALINLFDAQSSNNSIFINMQAGKKYKNYCTKYSKYTNMDMNIYIIYNLSR